MDDKMRELADALLKLQPEQRATVIAMVEYAASHGVGGKKRGRPANGAVVDAAPLFNSTADAERT